MSDSRCPNYFAIKNLVGKITEECCDSTSKYHSMGNFGGFGESAENNPCLCDNYKKCSWFLEDNKPEEENQLERNSAYSENDIPGLLW